MRASLPRILELRRTAGIALRVLTPLEVRIILAGLRLGLRLELLLGAGLIVFFSLRLNRRDV